MLDIHRDIFECINYAVADCKNKWVFKIKRNGVFQAQLVACGYSQIPGIDFQEHFTPVVNDVSYRIMIAMMMSMGMKAKIVDIETQHYG